MPHDYDFVIAVQSTIYQNKHFIFFDVNEERKNLGLFEEYYTKDRIGLIFTDMFGLNRESFSLDYIISVLDNRGVVVFKKTQKTVDFTKGSYPTVSLDTSILGR
ncbi:hypothetical protein JXC34_02365 [Candidatus Woesearchaeota archaeon]|nr:hypothetical protein [Candidatus Woesearchaeota archaeon]